MKYVTLHETSLKDAEDGLPTLIMDISPLNDDKRRVIYAPRKRNSIADEVSNYITENRRKYQKELTEFYLPEIMKTEPQFKRFELKKEQHTPRSIKPPGSNKGNPNK
ncbi:protein translocase subunit SecA [Acrasis kona]|uniref:Protein translocase subunit SecA n=1 Tax=Acrasis kona TaxID=1008807 RepID=A0AAW2Z094_9EUKA